MKKVLLGLLSLLAIVAIAGCRRTPEPESITLSDSAFELEVGETATVTATIEPEEADQDVEWSSSAAGVATVSNGTITAVAPGTATITASSALDSDINATVSVTVIPVAMDIADILDADEGDEVVAVAVVIAKTNHNTFQLQDSTGAIAVYSPDFTDEVNVGDEIRITGERGAFNGLLQISNVESVEVLNTGQSLPQVVDITEQNWMSSTVMLPFQSHRVAIDALMVDTVSTPSNAIQVTLVDPFNTDRTIALRLDTRLDDTDAEAMMNDLSVGDVIDISDAIVGWFHSQQLLVTSATTISASDVDLGLSIETEDAVSFYHGLTKELEWTVQPEAIAQQGVSFESSDTSVVTVDDAGLLTSVAPGTATVTITSDQDSSVTADVTVTVEQVEIVTNPQNLKISEEKTLEYFIVDEDYPNQGATFEVANENILTIDAEGVMTGHAVGGTYVTITSDFDTDVSREVFVTVERTGITLPDVDFNEDFFVYELEMDTTEIYHLEWLVGGSADFDQTISFTVEDDSIVTAELVEVKDDEDNIIGRYLKLEALQVGSTEITITSDVDPGSDLDLEIEVSQVGLVVDLPTAVEHDDDEPVEDGDYVYLLELYAAERFELSWSVGRRTAGINQKLQFTVDIDPNDLIRFDEDFDIEVRVNEDDGEYYIQWRYELEADFFERAAYLEDTWKTITTLSAIEAELGDDVNIDGTDLTVEIKEIEDEYVVVWSVDDDSTYTDVVLTTVAELRTHGLTFVTDDIDAFRTTMEYTADMADYTNGQAPDVIITVTTVADASVDATIYTFILMPTPSITVPPIENIYESDDFDLLNPDAVFASDAVDGNLTGEIEIYVGEHTDLDGLTPMTDTEIEEWSGTADATYKFTYAVTNSYGVTSLSVRTVNVFEDDADIVFYPTGFYNFLNAPSELKHTLFAHAERYLMETMYGGIPVYMNAGYNLYSTRIEFPTEDYVPVMGFGTAFATFDRDDSNVRMEDGSYGNVGEYTYRGAMTSNPDTLHQWNYTDAISSDMLVYLLDNLYYFAFNEDNTGYELKPSMATDMPTPVEDFADLVEIDTPDPDVGRIVSNYWTVDLREDLEWKFHPDTDTTGYSTDIDAHDFINTYKTALEENWFRAISGGGDFTSSPQEIVNAQRFADGEVTFDQVGLKVIDDYTLGFNFVESVSEWNVIYWLSSFVMTPIHLDLWDDVGDAYGTTAEAMAYHGPYWLEYFEPDQILRMAKNENFHEPDRHFFTHQTYRVIEDSEIRFQEFLNGSLEAAAVPGAQFEQYQNYPTIRFVPGAVTFRLAVNSLGTDAAQQARFPGSSFTPSPILAHKVQDGDFAGYTMRNAIFHVLNRQVIADEVLITNEAQMYYFSDAYLVAPEEGISFRQWDYERGKALAFEASDETDYDAWLGAEVFSGVTNEEFPWSWVGGEYLSLGIYPGNDLLPYDHGFSSDLATGIFKAVIDELDNIDEGTEQNPNIIEWRFTIQSGSEGLVAYAEFVRDQFEEYFYHDEKHIGITIDIDPVQFPDNYFDRILIGNTDMGMGGISGSTLDAASFLDVFADDVRGGFTMDWGIDTSTANIPVTYTPIGEDEPITQMWSFNALVAALNGTAYVVGGEEATPPAQD